MAFFSFGKRVRNQRFTYLPRYYDPAKEDLESRLRMASDEASPELTKMRIKDGLRRRSKGAKEIEKKSNKRSNIRLLLIVGILVLVTYYFLTSDGLLLFIESMSG